MEEKELGPESPACPDCGSKEVRRSWPKNPWERFRGLFGVYPHRCETCDNRFLAPDEPGGEEQEGEPAPNSRKTPAWVIALFVLPAVLAALALILLSLPPDQGPPEGLSQTGLIAQNEIKKPAEGGRGALGDNAQKPSEPKPAPAAASKAAPATPPKPAAAKPPAAGVAQDGPNAVAPVPAPAPVAKTAPPKEEKASAKPTQKPKIKAAGPKPAQSKPKKTTAPKAQPAKPSVKKAKPVAKKAKPAVKKPATGPVKKARSKKKGKYSVQMGAFSTKPRALKTVSKLKKAGFRPRVVRVKNPDGKRWYKVWVGWFSSRKTAADYGKKVSKKTGLKHIIALNKGR